MPNESEDAVANEINHTTLRQMIKKNYEVKQPLMIWGTTGIGKSMTVYETAQEICEEEYEDREFVEWNEVPKTKKKEVVRNPDEYFLYLDQRLAQSEPADLKGIPDLDGDMDAVEWKVPLWVYAVTRQDALGITFLDECNLAPNSVQSAFYQLILDRQIGSHSVSDNVYVLGAGNRAMDRANVYEMSAPLRNRFNHVQLEIPSAGKDGDWTNYAIDRDLDDRVVGYLASPTGETDLFNFYDNKDAKSFATPRKWEDLAEQIEDLDHTKEQELDLIQNCVASTVGQGIATRFRGFLKVRQNVDLTGFIENPEKVEQIKDEEVSLKHSIMTGVAAEYKNDTDILPQLVQIANHLDQEFGILLLRLAKQYNEDHLTDNIAEIDGFDQLSSDYAKYLLN